MTDDIRTVVWKELRELLYRTGGRRGAEVERRLVITFLLFALLFGIVFPILFGSFFRRFFGKTLDDARTFIFQGLVFLSFFAGVLPAVVLINGVSADVFAGERERHTLETLLASRLPDRAILLGKFIAVVGFGWGLSMPILIVMFISINVTAYGLVANLQQAAVFIGTAMIGLLVSGLVAALGTLISLGASTVRGAQQSLAWVTMVFIFAPTYLPRILPERWRSEFSDLTAPGAAPKAALALGAALLLLDAATLSAAAARFRRARLIVE